MGGWPANGKGGKNTNYVPTGSLAQKVDMMASDMNVLIKFMSKGVQGNGKGKYDDRQGWGKGPQQHGTKGKGKTGGKTQGGKGDTGGLNGVSGPGWPCRCQDCGFAVSGKMNYASRTACIGCKRPKSAAMSPEKSNSIAAPAQTQTPEPLAPAKVPGTEGFNLSTQEKKQLARKERKEATKSPSAWELKQKMVAPPVAVAEAPPPPMETDGGSDKAADKIEKDQEGLALTLLGLAPVPSPEHLNTVYAAPRLLFQDRKTPSQVAASRMSSSPTGEMENARQQYEMAVTGERHFSNSIDKELKAMLKKKVEEAKTALDKVQQPAAATSREDILQAIKKVKEEELARIARADTASENAAKVHAQSPKAVLQQIHAMQEMYKEMDRKHAETQSLWKQRYELLVSEHSQLLVEMQGMLAALNAADGNATKVTPPVSQYHASLAQVHREFTAGDEDLPVVEPNPSQKDLERCGPIWACLSNINIWDTMPVTTFAALEIQPHEMHHLMGNAVWESCWLQEHQHITEHHFIPVKMIRLLKHILDMRAPDSVRNPAYLPAGKILCHKLVQESQIYIAHAAQ